MVSVRLKHNKMKLSTPQWRKCRSSCSLTLDRRKGSHSSTSQAFELGILLLTCLCHQSFVRVWNMQSQR
ncbi:hypothetical protein Nepgr_015741 [Nepenthes gracilis]|uniref:Uncharacterized protein n=1 Tax=Nepenthes gracilis TaxID=150966 RepID=A0AAD3SND7_NEPGR|nr:hypothetical protein Nepgr_015741 [Nepenthes gracilis]